LSPDAFATLKICQKFVCGRGYAPDPAGRSQHSPDPLTGFGKGRRGKKWEGKGREGREGEEKREEERGGREGITGEEKGP